MLIGNVIFVADVFKLAIVLFKVILKPLINTHLWTVNIGSRSAILH